MITKKLTLITIALLKFSIAFSSTPECNQQLPPDCACCDCDTNCGWEFSIQGSYIYWQPGGENLELVEFIPKNPKTNHYKLTDLSTDFSSGFKIGLGTNFTSNDWEIFAEYTRFHPTNQQTLTLPNWATGLTDFWTTVTTDNKFHLNWKLKYDILTADLAKEFCFCDAFMLKLYGGLKGGWIDQTINTYAINLHNNTKVPADYYLDSWLIGPRIGCSASFYFCDVFRFFSTMNTALFYQKFDLKTQLVTDRTQYTLLHNPSYISPNFDLTLGFGWRNSFCNSCLVLDISAGYEFHYYFNQMLQRRQTTEAHASHLGGLSLQGLTVTAKLEF